MNIARWRDIWKRFHGRGTYPHELAFLLNLPLRRLVLSPPRLVERLHLTRDACVLEVGPGPGYFSVDVARHIPSGRLYLFDLQREMLDKARRRLRRAGVSNVNFTQGSGTALPFKPASFDVVFLVAVLGEVPDAAACVDAIGHCLRPGGLLSITELPGDPDALSRAEVDALAHAAGLEPMDVLPASRGFTANFRRIARTAASAPRPDRR